MLRLNLAVRFFFLPTALQDGNLGLWQNEVFNRSFGFSGRQALLERFQVMALPNTAHAAW